MSNSNEIVIAINPEHAQIIVQNADFCRLVQKGVDFVLVISGVTGAILIKFAQYVEKVLPLNLFESKLR